MTNLQFLQGDISAVYNPQIVYLSLPLFPSGGVPPPLLLAQKANGEKLLDKISKGSNTAYLENTVTASICQGTVYGQ